MTAELRTKEETVTVCASCLKASCWQGEFYCDDYKSAGTVEKTMTELLELDREHWSYWSPS
jgi:hypothetical protein